MRDEKGKWLGLPDRFPFSNCRMPPVRFQSSDGHAWIVNARPESTVLMQDGATAFTFDCEGRLIGAFLDARNYRRSLGNKILEKSAGPRPGLSGRLRLLLSREEVQALEERGYAFARTAAGELSAQSGEGSSVLGPREKAALQALARIAGYSFQRLEQERELYERIYRPVTILPPDQYQALYLQLTEGCVYNHCRFCGFYRDRAFRVKSLPELEQHMRQVRALLGGAINLRRSIFLGDANALLIPQPDLLRMLDAINARFPILPPGLAAASKQSWKREHPVHFAGIYSFMDAVKPHGRSPRDYAELAARGLRRVYIGLESGDPELLRFLGKPHTAQAVVELVEELKAGRVAVGVIVLAGVGGRRYEKAHVQETVRVLNAMPLDERDLIYFSELVDYPGSTYAPLAAEAGIAPLTLDEVEQQIEQIRAGLLFSRPERAPRISYYDIREFIY